MSKPSRLVMFELGNGKVCCCFVGHMLPMSFWFEPCPICDLIRRAEVAIDFGEWAHFDVRDELEESIKRMKKAFGPENSA